MKGEQSFFNLVRLTISERLLLYILMICPKDEDEEGFKLIDMIDNYIRTVWLDREKEWKELQINRAKVVRLKNGK